VFFKKKFGQRLILSVGVLVFLSFCSFFLWMEYRHERILLEELENQKRIVFIQIVNPRREGELIQRVQLQRLKEISTNLGATPSRVKLGIARGLSVSLFFTLTLGLVFYFWLRNRLLKPLKAICEGMRIVAAGNTSLRLNWKNTSEVEMLSQEFNRMAGSLEKFHSEIYEKAEENAGLYGEAKKMHQALEETQKQLIYSEKLSTIGQMAAGIAHEMNNPLTTILGYTQIILTEMEKDNPNYEDLKKVEQETKRILKITQNLLTYSRPRELKFVPVEIPKIIDYALELVHHEKKYKNVEVVKNYNDCLPLVKGDEGELVQVFVNLFTNALHAFNEKDKLYKLILTAMHNEEQKTVEIEVSDTGEGIAPENLPHIFEPFFTTKRKNKGSGLGLFVIYAIIARHQGKVEVKSELNQGTTFLITLPENVTKITL